MTTLNGHAGQQALAALAPFGVSEIPIPASASRIWQVIREAALLASGQAEQDRQAVRRRLEHDQR